MYLLEDRILFDGAAAVDVAAAAAALEAQQQQEQEDAQEQQNSQDNSQQNSDSNASLYEAWGERFLNQNDSGINSLIADAMNLQQQDLKVLVVSDSIINADSLISAASSDTVVVSYDAENTSLDQLLGMIKSAVGDNKIDSIAFAVNSTSDGSLVLSSDGNTSVTSLTASEVQQQFWSELGSVLDSDGRIDLLSSGLAATDEGNDLIEHISDLADANVAASTDLTGADGDWILETDDIDLVDLYFDGEKIDAFSDNISILSPTLETTNEVAFVDSGLADVDSIIEDLEARGITVVGISGDNAIDQITDYLVNSGEQFDSIQIFSHGNDGHFKLGSTTVSNATVDSYSDQLAAWGDALSSDGDILIYGCDVAANDDGIAMLQKIADFTGADVAASTDTTGFAGNWALEYQIGLINSDIVNIDGYGYNLVAYDYYQTVAAGDWDSLAIWQGSDDGVTWTALVAGDDIPSIGSTITVQNNITVSTSVTISSVTVNSGAQITISNTGTMIVDNGGTLTVDGTLVNDGTLINKGAIDNSGSMSGAGGFDFANNANTVTYSGGTDLNPQSVIATTYDNLVVDGIASVVSDITIQSDMEINGSLTAVDVTVDGDMEVTGTFVSTGNIVFSGASAQSVSGNGSISFHNVEFNNAMSVTIESDINVSGDFTNSDGFSAGSGTIIFNGSDGLVAQEITGNLVFNNLTISNTGVGVKLINDITVTGDWNDNGHLLHNNQSVTLSGTTQTITGTSNFYDLIIENGSSVAVVNDLQAVNLYVNDGSTVDVAGNTNVTGNLTFEADSAGELYLAGSITIAGSFSAGTGTVIYDGMGNQTIYSGNYYNLITKGNGTKSVVSWSNVSIANVLNVDGNSTFHLNVYATMRVDSGLVVGAGGTLTVAGTMQIGSGVNWTIVSGGAFNSSTGSVIYLDAPNTTVLNTVNYYNLTLQGAGGVDWRGQTVGQTLTIANGLNVNVDTNAMTVKNLVMQGNSYLGIKSSLSVSGSFTRGTGTVEYSRDGAQTIAGLEYYNLILSGSGTKLAGGDIGIWNAFTRAGSAVFSGSNYTVTYRGNNYTITELDYYNLALSGNGTISWNDNVIVNGKLSIISNITLNVADTFGITSEHFTASVYGTINYSGANQTISALEYNNLSLSGSGTKTAAGSIVVGKSLSVADNIVFAMEANALTVTNSMTLAATAEISSSSSVTFYNDLILNGTLTTTGMLHVSGNLTVADGRTLQVGSLEAGGVTLNGTLVSGGTVDVTNDLSMILATSSLTANGAVTVRDLTVHGTFTATGQTVTVRGLEVYSDGNFGAGSVTAGIGDITVDGGTFTASGAVKAESGNILVDNSGTLSAASIDVVSGDFTVNGTVDSEGAVDVAGRLEVGILGRMTADGLITVDGSDLSVSSGGELTSVGITVSSGYMSVSGVLISTGAVSVGNYLTMSGRVDATGQSVTVGSDLTMSDTAAEL